MYGVKSFSKMEGAKIMEPWKERFIQEYVELKDKTEKLSAMLEKYQAGTLPFTPKCSYNLFLEQYVYMTQYLRVLAERAKIEGIDIERSEL